MGRMAAPVRLATRASLLALTQSRLVAGALERAAEDLQVELVEISTKADRSAAPIEQLGGTGVFVTAVREALYAGRCELAVHSLKDLPTRPAAGLAAPVVPPRGDPRDALCARDGLTLETLPSGAVVGTGSPRRRAALLAARPDLQVVGLRGNVDTRLRRVGSDLDAIVLAVAGLERIGRLGEATQLLGLEDFLPAPGQGALAVETRADLDPAHPLARALAVIEDPAARAAVLAERALLARLEAGCSAPVGAFGEVTGGRLTLTANVLAPDGRRRLDARGSVGLTERGAGHLPTAPADGGSRAPASASEEPADDDAARHLGTRLAEELLARGAAELAGLA